MHARAASSATIYAHARGAVKAVCARAPARMSSSGPGPLNDREKAFESKWAHDEQRKALDALKKTMAAKLKPMDEQGEKTRLTTILNKIKDRDALKDALILWKHDEVRTFISRPRSLPVLMRRARRPWSGSARAVSAREGTRTASASDRGGFVEANTRANRAQ